MTMITTLSRIAGLAAAILLAFTGAMLTYEVIARYFFVRPTIWAAELSQLCLIWGCLLAMAHVLHLRRHITVNAVTNLLPSSGQKICAALSLIAVIVFSLIVMIWGWDIFHESFVRGRTTGSLLNLPVWIAELSVPVGFGLLAAQGVVELIGLRGSDAGSLGASHE
ncbi:TRAP transporter small permease [Thalassococcus sp. S3]|uniref:TRAP transporter small permease n=1 Tax=Thalassococcus sp. S3 TaxID=2017482 RepID=UPI0010243EF2|nr:TRAP transporter small permease [Thalassococcus sp. S3]QBF29838.1 C4-dicarboxylate ABC transporter substrate-binding protein [Thalassococcus sp. S3]